MRVAVVAPNWIGDAVMSLPLVGSLAASGAQASVIAREYVARVYAGVEGVADLVVMPRSPRARRIFFLARTLDALSCDATVVLPPSFSAALGAFLGGAAHRVGYATDARGALLHDALDARGLRDEHVAENYVRVGRRALERAGYTYQNGSTPAPRVFEKDRQEADGLLEGVGVRGGHAYAVLVPGAAYGPAKTWPPGRFSELARRLSERVPVLLAGADSDRWRCEGIAKKCSGVHVVAGRTSPGGFFALLAGAGVVVANDSGAVHVSAALGVPTVVLFGSTSPVWTAPQGRCVRVVREPVPCSPCFRKTCPTELECFGGIEVDRVASLAGELLGAGAPAAVRPAPDAGSQGETGGTGVVGKTSRRRA